MLGLFIVIQILRGVVAAIFYINLDRAAFKRVLTHIIFNVEGGNFVRLFHINGASFIFIILYIHMGRGFYYYSFSRLPHVWWSGRRIYILCIAVAFLGYVLP